MTIIPRNFGALLGFVAILVVSYINYFQGFEIPNGLYWDEMYHIPSAQKYLHGIHFMEPHPPLGKLLIALGEYLFESDHNSGELVSTMMSNSYRPNSMFGYRFFPALLAWLTAPLIFLILFLLTRSNWISILGALFYCFDNALIVQGRLALLEGPQLFFGLLSIFFILISKKERRYYCAMLSGIAMGACVLVKLNGLIFLVPLVSILFASELHSWTKIKYLVLVFLSALVVHYLVWCIAHTRSNIVNHTLENNGFFTADEALKEILNSRQSYGPKVFFHIVRNYFHFMAHYQRGVPDLNMCKPDERGSPAILWPLGATSILYGSEKEAGSSKYLYLQSNPVIWIVGFISVLVATSLLVSKILLGSSMPLQLSSVFPWTFSYWSYMFTVTWVSRSLYLYHYFIPLIFTFLCAGTLAKVLLENPCQFFSNFKRGIYVSLTLFIVVSFLIFRPLTFYLPIDDRTFEKLKWSKLWDLVCYRCASEFPFARPVKEVVPDGIWKSKVVYLGDVPAVAVFQEWGEPMQNTTVTGAPVEVAGRSFKQALGVHAFSRIIFALPVGAARFSAEIGVPSYIPDGKGSVVFEIYGDRKLMYQSRIMRGGDRAKLVELNVRGITDFALQVRDAGDGIVDDHAIWGNPWIEVE